MRIFKKIKEILGWGAKDVVAIALSEPVTLSNYVFATAQSMAHTHNAHYNWRAVPSLADKFTNTNNIVKTIFLEASDRHRKDARAGSGRVVRLESHVIRLCNEIRDEYKLHKAAHVCWGPNEIEVIAKKAMKAPPVSGFDAR